MLAISLVNRRGSVGRQRVWYFVTLAALVSLMPLYRGKYDRVLMLIAVPCLAESDASGQNRMAWPLAALLTFWQISDRIFDYVLGRAVYWPTNRSMLILLSILLLWAIQRPSSSESIRASSLPVRG